jgi:hypothetical protein
LPIFGRHLRFALIFVENEIDCTSETGRGQFSIFGAIEENVVSGFSG